MFGFSELAILLIVVIVVIVFFGAKKLPELARNAGKAARILKSESKTMKAEDAAERRQDPRIIKVQPGDRTGERPGDGPGAGTGPVRT
ncbi:twin-arginine translocase TatA/TatE family subunit [Streptomyces flavidovirens]|uniref:twin-arginine translocase TatA/TatE family subunit n=1 Tax=Streptomyces flavidovirens TaxID=67298 RepID=UPI0003FC801A|nr:twin-arginine translocase TatA/TatE family subunit [Streptomyces flavidovirens]